jgi:moderate conductance mechanosensitive channel
MANQGIVMIRRFVAWSRLAILAAMLASGPCMAQTPAAEPGAPANVSHPVGGWVAMVAKRFEVFLDKAETVAEGLPGAPIAAVETAVRIFEAPTTGLGTAVTLLLLAACVVVVFLPPWLLPRWQQGRSPPARTRARQALRRIGRDILDLGAVLLFAALAATIIFGRPDPIDQFAVAVLWACVRWRLSMAVVNVCLRPGEAHLRVIPIDDATARAVSRRAGLAIAVGLGFITTVPVFLDNGLALHHGQGLALVCGTLACLFGFLAARRLSQGMPYHARRVVVIGGIVAAMVWGVWMAAVVLLEFSAYHALTNTLFVAWTMLVIDRLLELARQPFPLDGQAAAAADHAEHRWRAVVPSIQRSLIAIAAAMTVLVLGRVWIVDVLELVSLDRWHEMVRAAALGLVTLVLGYVSYELLRAWSAARFGTATAGIGPDAEDDAHAAPASRLGTVLPIISGFLVVSSVILAALLTLSELGVNIMPLIAGAGIFGLAISFGSQALVRDIVSGLFYMVDDALRVGEYIEAGRYKGTVEKISLRSLRLRHQNGQIHTIPFGQLGAVTNFSRDWVTIKFNLRLSRDADIELARKLAKRVGQDMLDDPELGKEFLAPLKMQGVADILETALVCRFKFTVRPGKPTFIQREALKRVYKAFLDKGIPFASNAVIVQSASGAPVEMSAAAVIAGMTPTSGREQGLVPANKAAE